MTISAKLFKENGYRATSLDDIAKQIDFTKPAIYYYFNSKQDILYEICESGVINLVKYTRQIEKSNLGVIDKITRIVTYHIKMFSDSREVAGVYLAEESELPDDKKDYLRSLSREYENSLRTLFNQGMDEGVFRPLKVNLVARAISGMCNWLSYWYRPEGPVGIDEIAAEYIDFMLHGCLKDGSKG